MDEDARLILDIEDTVDATGKPLDQLLLNDTILNADVRMKRGNERLNGKVEKRAVGAEGRLIGTYDGNPMLNTMVYGG